MNVTDCAHQENGSNDGDANLCSFVKVIELLWKAVTIYVFSVKNLLILVYVTLRWINVRLEIISYCGLKKIKIKIKIKIKPVYKADLPQLTQMIRRTMALWKAFIFVCRKSTVCTRKGQVKSWGWPWLSNAGVQESPALGKEAVLLSDNEWMCVNISASCIFVVICWWFSVIQVMVILRAVS